MNKQLKEVIEKERILYIPNQKSIKQKLIAWFEHNEAYTLFCFMRELCTIEYYSGKSRVRCIWHGRKLGKLSESLGGYYVSPGCLGQNVQFFHRGNTIINYRSKIGDGCRFHGDNCVGNNGKSPDCPVLGRNTDVGIGAKIIGGITLADDIKIGANAVVTKSFLEPGITIAGIPARKIK